MKLFCSVEDYIPNVITGFTGFNPRHYQGVMAEIHKNFSDTFYFWLTEKHPVLLLQPPWLFAGIFSE